MLYLHTVRYLKPVQVLYRLRRYIARPTIDPRPAPGRRSASGQWTSPVATAKSYFGNGEFRLLGEAGNYNDVGWDGPQRSHLWRYNQHYFADLLAADAGERPGDGRALLDDWLASNAPGQGVGWEPYPTSLRIVNWLKWELAGNDLGTEATNSLAIQARWLASNLERHILGNHLFVNAKALAFAGCWFEGDEAQGWLEQGLRILETQLPEQFLADGGQFELSPMYHALALEDVLDLHNVMTRYDIMTLHHDAAGKAGSVMQAMAALVPRMQGWLRVMTHPDGDVAFFNDAAFGIAPHPTSLHDYAERLGFATDYVSAPVEWLEASGYARLTQPGAVVIVDMAEVGPDYLPGHAHADTLSFELSVAGERLVVNGGTSEYGTGSQRQRQRSTGSHSTAVVDGEDSSEVWGGFRVARRARILYADARQDGDNLRAGAAHDGFHRLPDSVTHERQWTLSTDRLIVEDSFTGSGDHRITLSYPLAPGWTPKESHGSELRLVADGGLAQAQTVSVRSKTGQDIAIDDCTWHPRFGEPEPAQCLRVALNGPLPLRHTTEISWGRQ